MKEINLNHYFKADSDTIFIEDEKDFERLCSDYLYYENMEPHTPIKFFYVQEIFGEEAILWDGVYEIDDYAKIIGTCNRR